jgi:hypothetical protein
MFHRYVASISSGCCPSRSGCCIYCNGCTRMLQASVLNVSSVFLDVCCKCVYLYIAYVSHTCCKCFIWMLRIFYNGFKCFSGVFASVLDAYFKCFICLHTYVVSVASGCFKSRLVVTSPSLLFAALSWCLLLLPAPVEHPPPLPLFSILVTFGVARETICERGCPDAPSIRMSGR